MSSSGLNAVASVPHLFLVIGEPARGSRLHDTTTLDSRLLVELFGLNPPEARVTMPLASGQRKFPNSPKPLKTLFASNLQ